MKRICTPPKTTIAEAANDPLTFDEQVKNAFYGNYLHWNKLRRKPMPNGLPPERVWKILKFWRTTTYRSFPLLDTQGKPFQFSNIDAIQEMLHHIDQDAAGRFRSNEIIPPAEKDRYIISSLMEEAIRSSQLEGAATTRRDAKEMIRSQRNPTDKSERMILNNFNTMRYLVDHPQKELTPEFVFQLHRMITKDTLANPDAAGRFRNSRIDPREDIRVYSSDNEVLHTPPDEKELPERMKAMCAFTNGESPAFFVHPVLRAVILHFWLAYDHPFVDGNGRTARALFYWLMIKEGYWLCEFLSISSIFRNAPAKYSQAFLYTETDDNDLTYFIIHHLKTIQRAITELHKYIKRKTMEVQELDRKARNLRSLNHRQKALISHALKSPELGVTVYSHQGAHDISYGTARSDLKSLADKGLLIGEKNGKTQIFYPAPDLKDRLTG